MYKTPQPRKINILVEYATNLPDLPKQMPKDQKNWLVVKVVDKK